MIELTEDLGLLNCRQNTLNFLTLWSKVHLNSLNIGNSWDSTQKELSKLSIHPWALKVEVQTWKEITIWEKLTPFPIPIVELLKSLPLIFIVAH